MCQGLFRDRMGTSSSSMGQEEVKQSTKSRILLQIREFFVSIITGIIIALIIWGFVMRPFVVFGLSMFPAFNASSQNGDYILAELVSYKTFSDPERGEVVVVRGVLHEGVAPYVVKRIIGLPGEKLRLTGNKVYISVKNAPELVLDEPYIDEKILSEITYEPISQELGDGEYFLLGDNRNNSFDSRHWGVATRDEIIGRVFLRLLPLDQITLFPGAIDKEANI